MIEMVNWITVKKKLGALFIKRNVTFDISFIQLALYFFFFKNVFFRDFTAFCTFLETYRRLRPGVVVVPPIMDVSSCSKFTLLRCKKYKCQ